MSMTYSSSSSNSNKSSSSNLSSSFSAKLRRLRIEESILLQNINKTASSCSHTDSEVDPRNFLTFTEFKKFCARTKNTYNDIKLLFEDVKASTSSKELIKSLDIDDIKKTTLDLENNIKSFKSYLHSELSSLKVDERQLNLKLNDPMALRYLKRKPRVPTAKYTEFVPSPVKTLMTSPFKCSEVQEFQDFMKNSKNRYGGWDEYHHNIFVNIWQKYFDADDTITMYAEGDKSLTEHAAELNLFLRECQPKLIGIREEEIMQHVKWYTKFLYLKDRQQKAIDKWRSNRRMMKPSKSINIENEIGKDCNVNIKRVEKKIPPNKYDLNNIVSDYLHPKENRIQKKSENRCFIRKCLSEEVEDEFIDNKAYNGLENKIDSNEETTLHFLKSTKQWNIRCSIKEKTGGTNVIDVENLKKLGSPLWRAGL